MNHIADTYNLIGGAAPGVSGKSWTRFLWSTGARYNFSNTLAAFANVGTSFISPAAKSVGGTLHAADAGIPGRNGQLPNPDLKPESGIGSDFGVDMAATERATFGVRGFYNRVSDAIVDNVVSNTPSQTRSVNAGDARAYGLELVYDHYVGGQVHFFINFTRTATRISNPFDKDQEGAALSFVPGCVFNAGMDWNATGTWKLTPYVHAVGRYFDSTSKSGRSAFGPYQVVNLKIEKTLIRSDSYTIVLFTYLNNLTNRRYLMPWQFRDPGFNVLGGLDFRF